jgi:hypothetical protein
LNSSGGPCRFFKSFLEILGIVEVFIVENKRIKQMTNNVSILMFRINFDWMFDFD